MFCSPSDDGIAHQMAPIGSFTCRLTPLWCCDAGCEKGKKRIAGGASLPMACGRTNWSQTLEEKEKRVKNLLRRYVIEIDSTVTRNFPFLAHMVKVRLTCKKLEEYRELEGSQLLPKSQP